MEKGVSRSRKWTIIQYMFLLVTFAVLVLFMEHRFDNIIDSDVSSELVLSNFLAEEKSIMSSQWYYTTELRAFTSQLIFTPLFCITSDWHTVRIVGSIIHYIILLVSLFYFCSSLGIKQYFPVMGCIFLLPFSNEYFMFVLRFVTYIPHIVISLLVIGMMVRYVVLVSRVRKRVILLFLGILSFLSGLNGIRQLYILYVPLLMASLLFLLFKREGDSELNGVTWKNRWGVFVCINLWSSCCAVIGYFVNSRILSKIYTFSSYENINWTGFSLERISCVIDGWLEILGFASDDLFSFATFQSIVSIFLLVGVILIVWKVLMSGSANSYGLQVLAGFLACAFVISVIIYSMTDMDYNPRYDLPILIFCFPIIVMYICEMEVVSWRKLLARIIVLGGCLSEV